MADITWFKQDSEPLFPDLLWSRPVNRRHAGKLLIIGGNSHAFNTVSEAYGAAWAGGAGHVRIVLPDALSKALSKIFPEAEFVPSTPSGSFGRDSLAALLDAAVWADGVLLAGDFGKNSETTIALEGFAAKYSGPLCAAGDTLENYLSTSSLLLGHDRTAVVADFQRVQKLAAVSGFTLKHTDDLHKVTGVLSEWSSQLSCGLVLTHHNQAVVAYRGSVSTTKSTPSINALAAYSAVWLLQQPDKPFEALTTAIYCLKAG